jgi:hypothetical protein
MEKTRVMLLSQRFALRFSRAVASGIVHRIFVIEHEKKLFPSIQFLRNLSTCAAASGVHPRERECACVRGRARARMGVWSSLTLWDSEMVGELVSLSVVALSCD